MQDTVQLAEAIRENIIGRRKQLGLSQADLAERMGYDRSQQSYISDVENGKRKPNWDTIERFAKALKTTPQAILTPGKFSSE